MKSSKKTKPQQRKGPKPSRFRKLLYWLLIDLAAAVIIFYLLLYKPAGYDRSDIAAGDKGGQVSTYLTHELLPQLYNGAQRQEPFDLIVTEDGINDIVAHYKWPKILDDVIFSAPNVFFVPGNIILIGAVNIKGVEFVITIAVAPFLDQDGRLALPVTKIKVGAMNITPLARLIAKRMYARQLATAYIDTEDLRAKIAASLLNDEPFELIFEVEDKKVRVKEVTITQGNLTIRLTPASD